MSLYRLLVPHSIGPYYFPAGTIAATAHVAGGLLPTGFVPSGGCDPLDTAAVNAFYLAGPTLPTPALFGPKPATYWLATPQATGLPMWNLTGLGAGKAPLFA